MPQNGSLFLNHFSLFTFFTLSNCHCFETMFVCLEKSCFLRPAFGPSRSCKKAFLSGDDRKVPAGVLYTALAGWNLLCGQWQRATALPVVQSCSPNVHFCQAMFALWWACWREKSADGFFYIAEIQHLTRSKFDPLLQEPPKK